VEYKAEQIPGSTPGLATDSPAQQRETDEVLYADMDEVLAASDRIAIRDAELLRLLAE
jgi:hypothetical protein